MPNTLQPDNEKILKLVGAIVIASQDAERCLKVILPFTNNSQDPTVEAALRKHEKLKKKTLGELAGKLVDSSTSQSLDFAQHLASLVARRNQIVHHFYETYGTQLSNGAFQEILDSLEALLTQLRHFHSAMRKLALFVMEGLRDITFRDTPEYAQMAAVCAAFRDGIAD